MFIVATQFDTNKQKKVQIIKPTAASGPTIDSTVNPYEADWKGPFSLRASVASPTCIAVKTMATNTVARSEQGELVVREIAVAPPRRQICAKWQARAQILNLVEATEAQLTIDIPPIDLVVDMLHV
ncbi:hypothetical protein FHL15_007536 [Xylaria flabelliformis]|uniref:Uncharacterized protein n=1 Tax=Xylaria flabelliformis TaxID=2512241 RepID=A0A553HUB5_9PEZI|nr:hypothetical protein FHL15_007536 [Xylaria flabelliformis]